MEQLATVLVKVSTGERRESEQMAVTSQPRGRSLTWPIDINTNFVFFLECIGYFTFRWKVGFGFGNIHFWVYSQELVSVKHSLFFSSFAILEHCPCGVVSTLTWYILENEMYILSFGQKKCFSVFFLSI